MSQVSEISRLVGRDSEITAIAATVDAVHAGRSQVLVLTGEAGIGKSALMSTLRERAGEAGLLVLEGRAAEHERDVPFGLAIDAFDDEVAGLHPRRLESLGEGRVADLAAVLPSVARHTSAVAAHAGPGERFHYHRALRALLELLGRERPLALLLDDLHWADDASLELVLHLLRRPPRVPLLLALAMRPADPAARVLDAVRAVESPVVLALGGLGRDAALALLGDVGDPALRDRLQHEAGGNPLYLRELARAAEHREGALPDTLIAAVQRQVAALPPASRALLDGAAVAGDPFDPELAAAAAGLDPGDALTPLDRLAGADLVKSIPGDRRFSFRHPIVRRAVYLGAPEGWRLGAHERAAAALADRGASAVVRAYHVEQSARPGDEAAIALLTDAAHASMNASPSTAARWFAAALRLIEGDDPQRRIGLLAPMALALGSAGRMEEARAAVLEVLDALPDEPTPARLALIAACAEVENTMGRHAEAVARLEEALDALPEGGDQESRASLEFQLTIGAAYRLDVPSVARWSARTLAGAEGGSDRALVAAALGASALASYWTHDVETGRPLLQQATAAYDALTDQELASRVNAAWTIGAAHVFAEQWRMSADRLERGLAVSRAFNQDRLLGMLAGWQAMSLSNLLELDAALPVVEAGEEAARLVNLEYHMAWAMWLHARVLYARGDALEARALAEETRHLIVRVGPGPFKESALVNLALSLVEEDPERALREMKVAGGEQLERLDPVWGTYPMWACAQACVAIGRLDEAEAWAAALERHPGVAAGMGGPVTRAAGARATVLLARDEAGRAGDIALAAADGAARLELVSDEVEVRLLAGQALAAAGRRDEAVAALQDTAAKAARGGARKWVDSAGRELRRLGARLSAGTARAGSAGEGIAGLTGREQEIASLVADGMSNKQVAAAVFLSEKTVENHLSRIFAKVGVKSRVELTRVLTEAR